MRPADRSRPPSDRGATERAAEGPGPAAPAPGEPVTRIKAERPEDVLALVPYLLGFRPEESLVAVLVSDGRVRLTARVDLPRATVPDGAGGRRSDEPTRTARLVAQLQELVDQYRFASVVLLAFSAARAPTRALLRAVVEGLDDVTVTEALLVDGRRWWSLTCSGTCCPPEGRLFDPDASPMAAAAVYAGLGAYPSRDAVAGRVEGPPEQDWPRLRALVRELRAERVPSGGTPDGVDEAEAMAVLVIGAVGPGHGRGAGPRPGLDDRERLTLARLAADVGPRDVAWALITRVEAGAHVALWQQVVERVPPELAAGPLCLLGMAAWVDGDGALVNCCSDRVARLDPGYSMGRLLAEVAARALPPGLWDAWSAQLRADLGLLAG